MCLQIRIISEENYQYLSSQYAEFSVEASVSASFGIGSFSGGGAHSSSSNNEEAASFFRTSSRLIRTTVGSAPDWDTKEIPTSQSPGKKGTLLSFSWV